MIGTITIGTQSTEILPHDNNREEIIIQKTSDAPVYLNFDGNQAALTVDNGFKLGIGDAVTLSVQQDNNGSIGMVTNGIYGIAAVAGKVVRVISQ